MSHTDGLECFPERKFDGDGAEIEKAMKEIGFEFDAEIQCFTNLTPGINVAIPFPDASEYLVEFYDRLMDWQASQHIEWLGPFEHRPGGDCACMSCVRASGQGKVIHNLEGGGGGESGGVYHVLRPFYRDEIDGIRDKYMAYIPADAPHEFMPLRAWRFPSDAEVEKYECASGDHIHEDPDDSVEKKRRRFRVFAEAEPRRDTFNFYVYIEGPDGKSYIGKPTRIEFEEYKPGFENEATISFSAALLQGVEGFTEFFEAVKSCSEKDFTPVQKRLDEISQKLDTLLDRGEVEI